MSLKRRILKWGLIGGGLLLFMLWFGFKTFFFDPLGKDYEYDLSTLIPRNVDFYLSKADLSRDLDRDLTPSFAGDFHESPRGQAIARHPVYGSTLESLDLATVQEELSAVLDASPISIDPLQVFGGSDLAVAGYFQGGQRLQNDWAVYGRANWMGKLAFSLLGHPGLNGMEDNGIIVEEMIDLDEGGRIAYQLSSPAFSRTLYVERLRDVVIVGTDLEMFRQVPVLSRQRGQDSFGQTAKYDDRVNVDGREGDELELFLDVRGLSEWKGYHGRWPDPDAEAFATAFLGKFFQSGAINDAIGSMSFGRVIGVDLHCTLSSELLTGTQKRLYRRRGLDRESLMSDVASLIPQDVGLFMYGVGDIGDLLRQARGSAEDALVLNLDDLVRAVWSYNDVEPLIGDFDAAFEDRFAFCIRDNDYPFKQGDPPHDGAKVPAWALILWVAEEDRVKRLRETVSSRQADFGIHGREPGSRGVFWHDVSGGKRVYEYWSPLVAGTGHLSTVTDVTMGGRVFVISNHYGMCEQILKTHFDRAGGGAPQLAELSTFRTQVAGSLPSVNMLCWFNPAAMGETSRAMVARWAADKVAIDWSIERPRIEKLVLKREMPGAVWGALSAAEQERLDALVQPDLDAFEADFRGQHSDRFEREYLAGIEALEAVDSVLLSLALDKSAFDLSARVRFPLE